MKELRILCILLFAALPFVSFSQYKWKLEKDKDGIRVYTSEVANSSFKAVKVECTLKGNFNKLISVLSNVEEFKDWIYNNKSSALIKKLSQHEFIYYSETHMPWPLSNRDVVIHLKIRTDSLPKLLTISGENVNGLFPEVPGRVRVPRYSARWRVTMPNATTLNINYILEVDPGGAIPAWAANMFADKGPYGSFSKLAGRLKE